MRARLAVRAITCFLLAIACVAAPGTAQDAVQRAGRQARKVRPDAGARIAAAGALLEIEAGTVEAETEIEVIPLAGAQVATLDPGMTNVTGGGHGYRFGPHGSHFRRALRLTLPYDDRLLPAGMTTDDVRAFYFNESRGHWVPLERVSVEAGSRSVVSLTDHFTDIIAATLAVPDHPEVASFVPTQMQDMKAANPAQGIAMIQPPEPNPLGDARLSFPIDVPPGRNALQPTLQLSYSSSSGDGWLGLGWTLDVPAIEVETRWGVPRYGVLPDASGDIAYRAKETETYLMSGAELTPLAHRGAFADRTGIEKEFHARVEGSFHRILRHGDLPSNFWWEVIDRDGVRSLYGEPPVAGPGSATLRDGAGNIFRWALREVRDPHGNAMRFDYDLVTDTGIPGGTEEGHQLYLRAIDYTGSAVGDDSYQPGAYTVRFIRDSDQSLAPRVKRKDVQIDARGGFLQVTGELLRQIRVEFDGARVRQYEFNYEEGAFGKTRLASLRQAGADGVPIPGADHRFSYYDDVRDASGAYTNGFGPQASWQVPFDDVTLCSDLGPVQLCPAVIVSDLDRASLLGGSITHSVGKHAYVGLNCGLPVKENSGGLKGGSSAALTKTRLALLDVDGDGLPDKVFKSGSGFEYRANQAVPGGPLSFSADKRPLPGLDAISTEVTTTISGGPEAYFGGLSIVGNASATLSVGTAYSTDANGDGIADVVNLGKIQFGHLGPDGRPVYEETSAHTPLPLAAGTVDGGGLIQDFEPQFQDQLDQNPLVDVFRRWLAPYDGDVLIQGSVQLTTPSETADGVRVSIQHNESVLWSAELPAGDADAHAPFGVERIHVARGDRLYFRVQSVFEGSQDAVEWDPEIQYLDVQPAPDANRLDAHHYRASEDFVLAGRSGRARMPNAGDVHVTGVLEKTDTTSDDVAVSVRRNDAEIYRATMPWDSVGQVALDLHFSVAGDDTATHDVDEADRLYVQLVVDSPIDTRRVGWLADAPPELVYEAVPGAQARTQAGDPLIRILLPSDLDLYPSSDLTAPQAPWEAPSDGTISVTTALAGDWSFRVIGLEDPIQDGEIAFTVKRAGALLARDTVKVSGMRAGKVTVDGIKVTQGDSLFFDFSTRNASARGTVGARVTYATPASATAVDVPCALHTNVDFDDVITLGRGLYSQPNRGWSYAGYNGNPDRDSPERPHACTGPRVSPTQPILEADLVLDEGLAKAALRKQARAESSAVQAQKAYAMSPVFERLADGSLRASWRGPDESSWVQPGTTSSTRLGTHLVEVPCASDLDQPGSASDQRAVPRIGVSVSGGAGIGPWFGMISGTIGGSTSNLDFLDLNGDQFPELVGNGRAQFTLPNGGLEARNRRSPKLDIVRAAANVAASASLGGSLPWPHGGSRGTTASNSTSAPRGEKVENSMPSLGISGDLSGGGSTVIAELLDMNGDGLPDRVLVDGTVSLNLGYSFAPAQSWPGLAGLPGIDAAVSGEASVGAGLGFNDFIYGWAGGLSYSRSISTTFRSLIDLNGDGLPDRLREDLSTVWVAFNTGNGFGPEFRWEGSAVSAIASTCNATLGAGGFITIPIPIFLCSPVTVLFLIVNPGITASAGMARQQSAILDVNGDGYADHVESKRDDELLVAPNGTGRTNLLQGVSRPLGGSFTLDYQRVGNTQELPNSIWALSRVQLSDGLADDGPSSLLTTLSYAGPHYDRGEREFLGFGEVTEENRDINDTTRVMRAVVRTFRNDSHYSRGLIASETTRDGEGRPFRGSTFEYRFRDVATGVTGAPLSSHTATIFPMLVATETRLFEGVAGPGLHSRRTLEYDESGNVSRIQDGGEPGSDDALDATITYASCPGSPVRSRPTGIVVRSNGVMLAEREGTLDCATGDLVQIRQRVGDGTEAVTDLTYFPSGELQRVVGPANLHGQRYALTYEYDHRLGAHVTRIEDSFGLVSRATHDLRFGSPLSTTDANGQEIDYAYDAFGRLARVTGPDEHGTGQPTLAFEYHPEAVNAWALTRHLDTVRGPLDPIETVLFADGLGRVVQTKVDGTVHTSPGTPAQDVMLVSGRTRFDAFGRATEQYQPIIEPLGSEARFATTFDAALPSRVEYDLLDRPISVTLPNGSTTRYSYALAPDRSGELRQETTITDANGRRQRLYRDEQDALVAVREGDRGDAWTSYHYDALGRPVSITDALGNVTRIAYDGLGRRTQLIRPDAGTTRYEYDAASNLVALRTANLLARGEAIRYDYEFTRLSSVHYPAVPERALGSGFHGRTLPAEDITYTYGGPGAGDNSAGRLVRITDPSGFEERAYGRLGEVVRQTRRIEGLERGGRAQTFTTQFRYDTWGRLLGMTYPAGEALTYEYDAGGRVSRVTGRDRGQTFEYLRRLEYDKFQQQAYIERGNGVSTTASYRPEDQRLDRLQSASAAGEFQDLRFTYDPVGNVRSIVNDVAVPLRAVIGGPTEQHFEYDDLYRLTGATGVRALAHDKRDEYALSLRYDAIHNLLEKRQRHDIVEPSGQHVRQGATSDDFNYRYSSNQPHAAIEVGGRGFTFDANGNQTSATQAQPGGRRSIVWDDEDRVRSVFMNGQETRFSYDASGTRLLKSGHGDEVAYFNQFFTVRNGVQITQHVYVGDKRLASRLIGTRPGNPKKGLDPDDVFFLHTDPLGSTHFVTNAVGDVTEHLEYFPFGEIWTDDSKRGAVSDLKFSGRELDENTGLYYFGARYQDPELGQFLSVNPASASEGRQLVASGSAPLSVYAFANDNPIRLQNASGLTPSWWSQLGQTAALFEGAGGQAVGGSRAPPAGSGVFDDTDSPVLAGAASEIGDFTAGEGVGVFDASSPGKSAIAARFNRKYADMWGGGRPRSNAVVGERPVVERQRSNAVVGKAPELGRKRANAVVGGGLEHDENGQAPIILGENMDGRVTPFARSVGGETIVDWLDGREWSQQLNNDFIEWIKAEGRTVIDIGPDYARRLQRSLNPSSGTGFNCVYCGEERQLGGYTKVRQVFQWLGEFQGGVPGFDVYGPPGGRPKGMQQ